MTSRIKMAALSVAALVLTPGVVSAQTFNTSGNIAATTTPIQFSTTPSSSLLLQVTGWQINQSDNTIRSAAVGVYSPGMGVTGADDYNGNYNLHQLDNASGYTDFVLLQFNQAVKLTSIYLNSFTIGNLSYKDNDMSIAAVNIPEANWNSSITPTLPASWTNFAGSGTDGSVTTGITLASKQWLVAAGVNGLSDNKYDGFKIASLTVTAVPEPAAWSMMIVGFGAVGFSIRARRAAAPRTAEASAA